MKKYASAILLWGGLWGISEATVSYFVHLLLPGMGWLFYYPLAYGFMRRAYRQTGASSAVLLCALLSAFIKLTNLPISPRLDYVINPAVSIVLEGFVVWFSLRWIEEKGRPFIRYGLMPLFTSAAWRGLYLLYLLAAPLWIREVSVLYNPAGLLRFAVLETAGNALIIALFLWLTRSLAQVAMPLRALPEWANKHGRWDRAYGALSLAVVRLAVALQWML